MWSSWKYAPHFMKASNFFLKISLTLETQSDTQTFFIIRMCGKTANEIVQNFLERVTKTKLIEL